MTTDATDSTDAGGSQLVRGVRPVAEIVGGVVRWHIPTPDYALAQHYLTGTHLLYDQTALDAALADECQRLRKLVEAVRDANRDAEDADTFRLLKPGQERAWMALLAGLKGPNVANEAAPTAATTV